VLPATATANGGPVLGMLGCNGMVRVAPVRGWLDQAARAAAKGRWPRCDC